MAAADHSPFASSLAPLLLAPPSLAPLLLGLCLAACATPPPEHPDGSPAAGGPAEPGAEPPVVEPLSLPSRAGPTVVGSAPGEDRPPDEDAASLLRLEPDSEPAPEDDAGSAMRVLPGGVGVEDIVVGSGPEVQPGMQLEVHYVGRLQDGSEFDSSRKRDRPFRYEFGAGRVIAGWEEGIAGMRVGGVRRLLIPPHKGYGSRTTGSIPANSILDFEIELLSAQ